MGFKSDIVYFHVSEREAGSSKYTLKKMVSLALNGITSFSIQPIRLVILLGMIVFIISVAMMIVTLIDPMRGVTVPGECAAAVSGCHRRVCGEDLHGDQEPAQILYQ